MDWSEEALLASAREYLLRCYAQRSAVRVTEFAAVLNVPVSSLSRNFSRLCGCAPAAFFEKEQLQYARALLQQSDMRIADVAAAAGFGTPNTLFRAFRLNGYTSPRRYREMKKMILAAAASKTDCS
jgi:transcriptional regulator GlxA family with amidase domain